MRTIALALLLALAGCTRSNEEVLDRLAARSAGRPRPDLDRLAESEPAAPLREGPDDVTLPWERGRLPTVRGAVNGVSMPVVLDTGTSGVALSGPAAWEARVHVPDRDHVAVTSPGFDLPHRLAVFESLTVGPLRFGAAAATIAARERRGAFGLRDPAYAIAGGAVLSHFVVTLDYGRRETRLRRHGAPAAPGVLVVDALVGDTSVRLLVDSGATRVVLEPRAAHRLGLIDDAALGRLAIKGGGPDAVRATDVTLPLVRFGAHAFRDVPGRVLQTFAEDEEIDGLLGLGAFRDTVWTLDYAARRLSADPRE